MKALATASLSAGPITRVLATIAQAFDSCEGSEERIKTALELVHTLVPYEQIGFIEEEGAPEPGVLVLPAGCPETKAISTRLRRLFTLIAAEDYPTQQVLSQILDSAQSEGDNCLAVPLVSCSRAIGVLLVSRRSEYSEGELSFLSIVSAHLAAYLTLRRFQAEERARLREEQTVNQRKDEFLAVLGHELRNPLGALRNGILAAQRDDAVRNEALAIAARQVDQLSRLIEDLLDVARIAEGKIHLTKRTVALAATVARALDSVRPLMEQRQHELSTLLPSRPVFVEADPARLQQILVNLLSNAAKYTSPGGRIKLTVDHRGNEVVISVQDNGIGIAAEMIPRLFTLFTQLDRPSAGTQSGLGVGLAIVQRLATLHGGQVEAVSAGLGKGATFNVTLPALAAGFEASHGATATEEGTVDIPPCRILIVDDKADVADSLAILLELTGHSVHRAYRPDTALQEARSQIPDIVLLDIGLPGMDGYELAGRLRELAEGKPMVIVAITGYGTDRDRAKQAGIDAHLIKPVDFNQLQSVLKRLLKPRL